MSLSPAPLSLLIKAAPILTEEMYGDIQPAAWELLLSVDEHMAGAAGKRTKPLNVATLGAQLAVGHRALQDSFVVEESERYRGFPGGCLVFIDVHVVVCSLWSAGFLGRGNAVISSVRTPLKNFICCIMEIVSTS